MLFPYIEIIKKAFFLTRKNLWLWVFGLFIGGATGINSSIINWVVRPHPVKDFLKAKLAYYQFLSWATSQPNLFSLLLAAGLLIVFFLIIISGLAEGAVIWSTAELARAEDKNQPPAVVNLRQALRAGSRYLWQIIIVQVLITIGFLGLLIIFIGPILYLFYLHAIGRGVVLSILGLLILLPSSVVFGFLHLFGPIFLVLFHDRIGPALHHAFSLIYQKILESLVLAAVMAGFNVLFVLVLVFSILLLGLPVSIMALFLWQFGLMAGFYALLAAAGALAVIWIIVLSAGFYVFQNIVWVLAVQYMVRTRQSPEKAKSFASAPVV